MQFSKIINTHKIIIIKKSSKVSKIKIPQDLLKYLCLEFTPALLQLWNKHYLFYGSNILLFCSFVFSPTLWWLILIFSAPYLLFLSCVCVCVFFECLLCIKQSGINTNTYSAMQFSKNSLSQQQEADDMYVLCAE